MHVQLPGRSSFAWGSRWRINNTVNDVAICFNDHHSLITTLYEGVHSRPLPRAEALVDPDFKT